MVALPKRPEQEIVDRIYTAIEKAEAEKNPELYLGRLGSSSIGNECNRAIWLSWRAYAKSVFGGRMLRLFGTGHSQEDRIVEDLIRAGFEVWPLDTNTGKQIEATDDTGHFITKIDGIIKGVPGHESKAHLLEIKTHNKSSFASVVKHGVQKSKPMHYSQMQISMSLLDKDRGIYVALCKDDEQFYVERIKQDKVEQNALHKKIIKIADATLRPAGISDNIESFACKWCDMKHVCYDEIPPLRNCRTCRFSKPVENGEWYCTNMEKGLDIGFQRIGCSDYEVL